MPIHARPVVRQDHPERQLQRFLEPWLARGDVRILDAGCGYALPVDFPRNVWLVGLDASPEALAKNENIDEALVGDIATYHLPSESYDGILCWTVLEHLADPRHALVNMTNALKQDGLLIVGIPNLWSLKGLITKCTPHWFHVWVYRYVLRDAKAGTPGHGPYRTYLRREIAPARLAEVARDLGLERVYESTYESTIALPPVVDRAWSIVCGIARVGSLRRWDPEASEHVAVFRKIATHAVTGVA